MSTCEEFTCKALDSVLERQEGSANFERALRHTKSASDLLLVLHRYIQFNSVFGGGVASLSGRIAVRQTLFRDPDDDITALADRAAEVASTIFYAAIDEFGDPTRVHRVTHRTMAQVTLRAVAQFFGYGPSDLNALLRPDPATQIAVARILQGYGVDQSMDDSQIFRAIGFHIGSELLADQEFCILDGFLRERRPEMVQWLEQTSLQVGEARVCAYTWVACHTTVEAEHRDAAFAGARRALRCASNGSATRLRECVVEGFAVFGEVQAEFMRSLAVVPESNGTVRQARVSPASVGL